MRPPSRRRVERTRTDTPAGVSVFVPLRGWVVGVTAALGVAVVLLGVAGPARAAAPVPVPGPVVLVGVEGLRWADVTDETPTLQEVAATAAVGQLAVRSVRATTCPADGWLAVSAGRRAADVESPACRALSLTVPRDGGPAEVPNWADYTAQAGRDSFEATPGLLGQTLAAAGRKSVAIGPGAAVALAVPQAGGTATAPIAFAGLGTSDPVERATALFDDVRAALALDPDLVVVDAGGIQEGTDRATQAQDLDSELQLALGALPDDATVVLASLSDAEDTSRLRLLAATGPAAGGGTYAGALLRTGSTRQAGLAQTTDLLPTLLDALGVPLPADAVGSALHPVEAASGGGAAADRLRKLLDLDEAARKVTPIVPWFFAVLGVTQLLVYGGGALLARRGGDGPATSARRRRTLAVLRRAPVVFAAVPAATFLANLLPWWRTDLSGLAVSFAVVAFTVPLALIALVPPWWRDRPLGPLGVVGALTALVLAADVATGSHLMLSSLMGVQPVIAGRFYGFSNPGFGLFATGALLAAVGAAHEALAGGRRRLAVGSVAGIGLFALVVDAAPSLGADFGGPPAIIPAFALLFLLVGGWKVTWQRAVLVVVGTALVLVAVGVADWLRPAEDRTHLGRFVQTVIDGGAWAVVGRKAEQNFGILTSSVLALLIPVAAAAVVYALARPGRVRLTALQLAYDRFPTLRPGLLAMGVLFLLGFALNDSGVTIPVVSSLVLLPLLVATSARAQQLDDDERLAAALTSARGAAKRR